MSPSITHHLQLHLGDSMDKITDLIQPLTTEQIVEQAPEWMESWSDVACWHFGYEYLRKQINPLVWDLLMELEWKQCQIDALMLEYCPEDMTEEQKAEWSKHQKVVNLGENNGFR
jgi:hypothetical protein